MLNRDRIVDNVDNLGIIVNTINIVEDTVLAYKEITDLANSNCSNNLHGLASRFADTVASEQVHTTLCSLSSHSSSIGYAYAKVTGALINNKGTNLEDGPLLCVVKVLQGDVVAKQCEEITSEVEQFINRLLGSLFLIDGDICLGDGNALLILIESLEFGTDLIPISFGQNLSLRIERSLDSSELCGPCWVDRLTEVDSLYTFLDTCDRIRCNLGKFVSQVGRRNSFDACHLYVEGSSAFLRILGELATQEEVLHLGIESLIGSINVGSLVTERSSNLCFLLGSFKSSFELGFAICIETTLAVGQRNLGSFFSKLTQDIGSNIIDLLAFLILLVDGAEGQDILTLDNRLKILQHLAEPLGNTNHFIDTYLSITIGVHIRERLLINLKTLHWTRQYGPHLLVKFAEVLDVFG